MPSIGTRAAPAGALEHGHLPVLLVQAVEALVTDPAATYVDATFGRGGHARAILSRLGPLGRLIALDRDPQAAQCAAQWRDPRFTFVDAAFSRLASVLDACGAIRVQGVLADLGVSSPQIDEPARGFSLRADGPLDMRMDPRTGISATQWLAQVQVPELQRILRDYGDERFAAPIAKAIVARRESGHPLTHTLELAAVVAGAIPARSHRDPRQHPATRAFQAIRIHLNQELEEVALMLDAAGSALLAGGRLAVITFHSLEERTVKRFFEAHARPQQAFGRLPLREDQLPPPRLLRLPRIDPDAGEVAANPRARSARLRLAERTTAPWPAGPGVA